MLEVSYLTTSVPGIGGASIHLFCLFSTCRAWISGSCHRIVKHCVTNKPWWDFLLRHRWIIDKYLPAVGIICNTSNPPSRAKQDSEAYSVCAPIPMTLSSTRPVCGG